LMGEREGEGVEGGVAASDHSSAAAAAAAISGADVPSSGDEDDDDEFASHDSQYRNLMGRIDRLLARLGLDA
jgi:hypothetical protein